ncbi:hypothetical protein PGIGA_G00218470 [Pangasianodon gigas]|uniref:Uncharacterized protein n=1 Tax=Pangasianodon gigas TaxID=30993 RepID=A0ACC5WHR7_PANGG|nr:hypothetical protein [Pangasianodon gigas]
MRLNILLWSELCLYMMKMKALFICLVALLFINYSEALWCYGCVGKGCSGRREECGSRLQNPVCATINAPTFYMKGCMSEYICRQQQQAPRTTATCCSTSYCN